MTPAGAARPRQGSKPAAGKAQESDEEAVALPNRDRAEGIVPDPVRSVASTVGDSTRGPLVVLLVLALGLLSIAAVMPALQPHAAVVRQLAVRRAEIAGLGVSCFVAWALVALL